MPSYHLEERDSIWLAEAPLVVSNEVSVPASSDQVFAVLADIGNWQAWCTGVSETVVVGPLTTGVGARRKVKAGGVRFEERFVTWEDGVRVTFSGSDHFGPGLPLTRGGLDRRAGPYGSDEVGVDPDHGCRTERPFAAAGRRSTLVSPACDPPWRPRNGDALRLTVDHAGRDCPRTPATGAPGIDGRIGVRCPPRHKEEVMPTPIPVQ